MQIVTIITKSANDPATAPSITGNRSVINFIKPLLLNRTIQALSLSKAFASCKMNFEINLLINWTIFPILPQFTIFERA
jgi:hypothetical protein